jgi:hypothetical protein
MWYMQGKWNHGEGEASNVWYKGVYDIYIVKGDCFTVASS